MMTIAQTQNDYELHAPTSGEYDTLTKRLFERRITPEVIATFQIEPRGNGWQYPTPGGGLRFKNYDSNAGTKYAWLDGRSEPANALYYAADLKEQVEAAGGVCWYVSGEPDVWAMRSALIPYAFSGFTEKTINPQFADFLQRMGVMRLYIAPDLDETGAAFARKIATALQGTGIELDCRQLPAELGEHGDIGKAWQKYTAKTPFIYWLLGLPRWYPEPEKPKVEAPLVVSTGEWGDVPADYRKRIMDDCGVTKIKSSGFSNPVLCPFHKEIHPSAAFHEVKGLFCRHEWKWYKWLEVGAVKGIEPFKHEKPTVIFASPQMKREAKEELIRLGFTALCQLLDELYQQGFTGGEVLTVKEVQAACPNLSAWTVRNAIQQAEGKAKANGHFLREKYRCIYAGNTKGEKPSKNTRSKRKGRPAKSFRVPFTTELYATLGVKPETIMPISGTDLPISGADRRNAAQYRARVFESRIRQKEGVYPVKKLAEPLGISPKTVRTYCKRTEVIVTPNTDTMDIKTAHDIESLPVDAQELAEWRRDGKFFRGWAYLETLDGKYKYPPTQEGAACAGKRPIRLVKRLANHYKARGREDN